MARLNVEVSEEKRKIIKIYSTLANQNIKDFIIGAIEQKIASMKEPNELTIQTFKESDNEINLNTYTSWQEMTKKLRLDDKENNN